MFFRRSMFDDFNEAFLGLDRLSREFFGETNDRSKLQAASGETAPAPRSPIRGGRYPAVESFTKDGKLVLRAEVPGVGRDELDITVENGRLILSGEKKTEDERKEAEFHVREVSYGRFERSFILPEGVRADDVTARMENGVLEISMPLAEPESGHKIAITAGGDQKAA
jgi:HSP20 family protein